MYRNVFAACAASALVFGFVPQAYAGGQIIKHKTFDLNASPSHCADSGQVVLAEDASKNKVICAITGISGHFDGGGENGSVTRNDLGNWIFQGHSCQPGVSFTVTCFQ